MSQKFDLENIADTLMHCVEDTFGKTYNIFFSQDSERVERQIIEYKSRFRTFGLEKFNAPCYISAINFFASPQHIPRNNSLGFLILYLKEEHAVKMLKAMGFSIKEDDDDSVMLDSVGELTNIITEQFKKELISLKYPELTLSSPVSAKNDIADGVWFQYSEQRYHELSFYLYNDKCLVVSLSLAPLRQVA